MIKKMLSDNDIRLTYPVMSQLRTHVSEHEYVDCVKRQSQASGYQIAALFDEGQVHCLAGYRISESLAWGKFLYVDDLVSDQNGRSKNYGKQMVAWLEEEARKNGCQEFHLDSGVQRHGAHRFYLRERMDITCYHFAKKI
ncbi:MAG: GNAT family N-acetyltransferase [Candidatus Angelobacter sp. Gp1-AA117]|nr:MAG: GNAT family N-acetyltransferase [Candidatus Angelobacter sp. Gp1-AA117]